jgi:dipeptidyl aminopeptidase/acylaminoacyl peptidase
MTPDELGKPRIPSDPRVGPDGRVVFTVSRMDVEEDRYERHLWMADEDGVRRFTTGGSDSHPRWSPDGSSIAFLRKVDEKAQVAVIPADGGEARVISDIELGVEEFEWSPDGSMIAAVGVTWTDEWAGLSEDDRGNKVRRVTSVPYRFDNVGWVHDRRRHVWLLPLDESAARCLTPGDYDERSPRWSPDGATIAVLTDRSEGRGLEPGSDVVEIDVASGDVTHAVERGNWMAAAYAPDGRLHLLGEPSTDWPGLSSLWRREGDGALVALTEHLDRSNLSIAAGPPSILFADGDVITGLEDGGAFGVIRVEPDGTVHHLVTGQRVASGFHTLDGDTLVLVVSDMTSPGEVVRWSDGEETELTSFNAELGAIDGHHFRIPSDGVEIDAWVFLPPGSDDVPGLLNIHGGPASQYGFGFFDEFQVYAAAGYAVIACNPRGSSGRGSEFVKAVVGDGWGVVDRKDIGQVVEAALTRFPRIDAERLGVMGGSYGGFMTGWLTAHEDRWKSAVVERGLLSFPSFAGTSDIAATFPRFYTLADYPDAWETWWAKSPLAHVHQVTTPTLVIHSENDFRCPIEQGEQWFTALLRNGIPVEMLRFPGAGHELSRSGSPKHRRQRFEAILDWHDRHLRGSTPKSNST